MRAAAVHVFLFAMPPVIERRARRQHEEILRLDEAEMLVAELLVLLRVER